MGDLLRFACPHCGGALHAAINADSAPAGTVCTVRTVLSNKITKDSTDSTDSTARLDRLPARADHLAKASLWKRALAIAYEAIDACDDDASQTEHFKERAAAQGINYGARGGKHQRPLYASALDYAREDRRRRGSR